jgi:exopolysaccharide biosynthesis polyprenyl glycosylphosphotransferase
LGGTLALLRWEDADLSLVLWYALFAALVLAYFAQRRAYFVRLRVDLVEDVRNALTVTALAVMTTATVQVVVAAGMPEARFLAWEWLVASFYLVAGRGGLRIATARAARQKAGSPTLIVGAGRVGQTVAERLLSQRGIGLRPVGFLDKDPLDEAATALPTLGASWDLEDIAATHGIEHVVIAFSTAPTSVVLDLIRRCDDMGVTVSYVPRLYESFNGVLSLEHLGGIPLLTRRVVNPRGIGFRCKYAVDRAIAAVLVVFLLPTFIVVSIAVWGSVGRPILFRQRRVGRDGDEFEILKFRSMLSADDDLSNAADRGEGMAPGGVEGADRRTRLGALIRRASLDELPQLLNVVRGEMSLVGPRPERPEYVAAFNKTIHRYPDRHRVRVGITGWAQIHGLRGKTSLADRVEWDNYYIDNWTPWLDIKILLLTFEAWLRPHSSTE